MIARQQVVWVWLFVVFTASGLLNFGHFYLDDLARDGHGTALRRLLEEMTGTYASFVLLPGIVWLVGRVPTTRRTWPAVLGLNVVGLTVYTTAHTTLMALSRAAIAPLIGLGPYDYGNLIYRYPMEAAGDAVWYTLFATATYLFVRLRAARLAEIRAADLQRQLAQAQLENLQLQLNPHFLFNTLNAISAVMYEDVQKADAMLVKLSDFLRTVLSSSGVARVSLDEELAVERQYVEIMTTRLDRRLELHVTVSDGAARALVPFMLLQPLLENSIRHGMLDHPSLALEINAVRENGQTVIEVRDNGLGCEPGARSGIGLANVRSRLAHLYGNAATFRLEPRAGGGTRAIIAFPFAADVPV